MQIYRLVHVGTVVCAFCGVLAVACLVSRYIPVFNPYGVAVEFFLHLVPVLSTPIGNNFGGWAFLK